MYPIRNDNGEMKLMPAYCWREYVDYDAQDILDSIGDWKTWETYS